MDDIGRGCDVDAPALGASEQRQVVDKPEEELQRRPGVLGSVTLSESYRSGPSTLALACAPRDPIASMSVTIDLNDADCDVKASGLMDGHSRSPSQQMFPFTVESGNRASSDRGMSLLYAAIDNHNSGLSLKIRVPTDGGFRTRNFHISTGPRAKLGTYLGA